MRSHERRHLGRQVIRRQNSWMLLLAIPAAWVVAYLTLGWLLGTLQEGLLP